MYTDTPPNQQREEVNLIASPLERKKFQKLP